MKHVTIAPKPPESAPNDGIGLEKAALSHGFSPSTVLHLHPGDEGYRTPTIEDYERHRMNGNGNSNGKEHGLGILSDHIIHHRPPYTPTPSNGPHKENVVGYRHSANTSLGSLGERLLDKLHWRERVRHYTWTFFTITMATGGVANVLFEGMQYIILAIAEVLLIECVAVPYRFSGLYAIGLIFFFLNIILFIINIIGISLRFHLHPEMFMASILHPTERLFIPAAVVSFGTILLNISQYGPGHAGHWLDDTVTILFWIDAALAICASMGVYLVM